jgi:hypothetical protein
VLHMTCNSAFDMHVTGSCVGVQVFITGAGKRLTGPAAYKASQKDNPAAPVPKQAKAKRSGKGGGWRSKAKRKR